ncbi:hypothetical protein [Butyrivibrio sp. AE3009]|uniref:hypothetical protein n=1 Tax=Butyrivibrio sp. AE3009 TaxID=1280666 RepID=UPI0003B31E94|nr:hypothetical protein [Butyrivibrio sp. AE3009]
MTTTTIRKYWVKDYLTGEQMDIFAYSNTKAIKEYFCSMNIGDEPVNTRLDQFKHRYDYFSASRFVVAPYGKNGSPDDWNHGTYFNRYGYDFDSNVSKYKSVKIRGVERSIETGEISVATDEAVKLIRRAKKNKLKQE